MKKFITAILLSALVLQMTACGQNDEPTGPITITDQAGRTVNLEEGPAQTVVSCYYVSSYAMMALGLSDRMVGIENKADTRPIYQLSAPAFLDLPAVGTMKESNVELIASLDPDLVIMPMKLQEAAQTLTDLGLDVMLVSPESHEGLTEMLTLIGMACGVGDRAEELTGYYDEKIDEIAKKIEGTDKPQVYMGGNSSYLTTAPGDMYQSSLMDLAGGDNVAAALEGDHWTEVSYETVLAWDPEVIIVPAGAEYTAADVLADEQLAGTKAVKNDAVYAMPGSLEEWDSPIPSGILGTMWLASVLHPEQYDKDTFITEATAFYETFYGFTPSSDLLW